MPIIEEISESNTFSHHRYLHHEHRHSTADTTRGNSRTLHPQQSVRDRKHIANSGPRKILFVFLKWVIMSFILALFLFFICFAALVLLHFLLTNTAFRYHRRRRRRGRQSTQNSVTYPDSSISIEDRLPWVGYSASEQTTRDCAICLEGFREGELCRKLPDCAHLFHVYCVDSWLTKKPNCPVCRTGVQLNSEPSGSRNNSDDEWKFWWPVGA